MSNTIKLKRFDGASLGNPPFIFENAELVWDYTRKSLRIGDGVNTWEDLIEFPTQSVTSFLALTDTPATYGIPGQVPVINEAGTGLEFATVASSYELPIASADTLGGVKIGSGINITDGVISVTGGSGGGSELTFASGETEVTLPGTPSNGQIYEYVGTGDVWTITANAGQTIRLLGYTGNTLTAEHPYACVGLVFFNNVWIVRTQVGTLDLSTV